MMGYVRILSDSLGASCLGGNNVEMKAAIYSAPDGSICTASSRCYAQLLIVDFLHNRQMTELQGCSNMER
jgi:hypothetical protein